MGAQRRDVIGVYSHKSFDMVAGVMGILKAGCAYLPIDATYPDNRVQYILNDSKVKILLTTADLMGKITFEPDAQVVLLDQLRADGTTANPDCHVKPDDLCYVFYTSGSTGEPKGVILDHRGRVNNFYDFNTRLKMNESDRLLAISSISFDMCAYDVLGTLIAGAAIVLPEPNLAKQPIHWLRLVTETQVTVWHSVPTMLMLLCKVMENRKSADISSLKVIELGGDWIPVELPGMIRAFHPGVRIVCSGGVTEVSMDTTFFEIEHVGPRWRSIPYGRPMHNQRVYVLDRYQELLPVGFPGELCFGGVGVAQGYFNRPELTAERFLPDKWSPDKTGRLYRTGDMGYLDETGLLHLLGRMDFQVKINGVRIELGEIENCLKAHPAIDNAICLAIEREKKQKKLVAFIVYRQDCDELSDEEMRGYVKRTLPDAFVPALTMTLQDIPTTPNGKVNRKELLRMASEKWK
jgi:amino acid adenylation domain-containing protein